VKPEVLAWALLFVVVFGLAYRFFSWLLRRSERSGVVQHTSMPPRPKPVAQSEPVIEIRKPEAASIAAPPATPPPPRPVTVHPNATPPMPVPPAAFAATTTIIERTAAPVLVPDVRATLAPRPDIAAVSPSQSANGVHTDDALATEREHITIRKRGTRLRARKIGREIPSLNARIKDTRGPKTRSASVTRKAVASVRKRFKSLATRKGLEKAPPRRIGIKPEDENSLASAKAATKIVGALPRSPRVRFAATP
jgi:hypothetical protein